MKLSKRIESGELVLTVNLGKGYFENQSLTQQMEWRKNVADDALRLIKIGENTEEAFEINSPEECVPPDCNSCIFSCEASLLGMVLAEPPDGESNE